MRPRRVCRGISRGRANAERRAAGFNEAPACLPGNHPGPARPVARAPAASMRPRRVCRGIRVIVINTSSPSSGFNEAPACLPGNPGLRLPLVPGRLPASMRPRRVCRGIDPLPPAALALRHASMRPRRVCRGISSRSTGSGSATGRFNEAPACLPGNLALLQELAPVYAVASMRPRRVCRGILVGGCWTAPTSRAASMRPRRVCRGIADVGDSGPRLYRSFNEAPACLPGNPADARAE